MSIKEMTEYDFKLNIIEGKKYIWSTLTKLCFFFLKNQKNTHTQGRGKGVLTQKCWES